MASILGPAGPLLVAKIGPAGPIFSPDQIFRDRASSRLRVCHCAVLLWYIYSYCCVTTFGDEGGISTGSSRMAHMAFGHIQEFDPNVESISSYLERVGLYFVANKIESERQVAVFLSLIGGKNYALLRDLLLPQQPKDKSLDELMGTLKRHFEPKPVVIAERFHFHRRGQGVDESVAEYVAELRKLATHCRFGGYLEEALRDRLVCGLREESTQRALLTENELTLARALEIAQSREAVLMNAQRLKEPSLTDQNVYVVEAVSILLIGVNLGKLHVSNAINLGILLEYVEVVGSQLVCLNQHRNLIKGATLFQWMILQKKNLLLTTLVCLLLEHHKFVLL